MSPGKILSQYKKQLGSDYQGYLHHVKRVYEYTCILRLTRSSELLLTAAIFHDLDLWVSRSMDYLDGSASMAIAHAHQNNLTIDTELLHTIIQQHHRLRKIRNCPEAEAFRKADLIDLSAGWIRYNIPKSIIVDTERRYPRLGFTKKVLKKSLNWGIRHPFNPFPMLKL